MLDADDIDLIHRLWLDAVNAVGLEVHHRDVVRIALEDLRKDWDRSRRDAIARRVRDQMRRPVGQER
jgi:hypothetical protein